MRKDPLFSVKRKTIHIFTFFIIILTGVHVSAYGKTTEDDRIYLITNRLNSENQIINRRNLRTIYGLRTKIWPNGDQLTVFVFPDDHKLHRRFCYELLGAAPYILRRNWDRNIFSGKAGELITVTSPEDMKRRVAETPGAIGYIRGAALDDSIAVVEVN